MHYIPDAFTYFGILFLLIFCFNVNMRLAFFFRFSNLLHAEFVKFYNSLCKMANFKQLRDGHYTEISSCFAD